MEYCLCALHLAIWKLLNFGEKQDGSHHPRTNSVDGWKEHLIQTWVGWDIFLEEIMS